MLRRSLLPALVVLTAGSCSSSPPPTGVHCVQINTGCTCDLQPAGSGQQPQAKSCTESVLPDSQCCADPGWPSSGTCQCLTGAIFCGVVPGYESGADGGPGEDACVCSNDPYPQQAIGPTCYPSGTTTAGSTFGTCCLFSADAPGAFGVPGCVCAAGLHTCGMGGTPVGTCSAANFSTAPPACDQGTTRVSRCL